MKPVRIFVRIGALRRFHALKHKTSDLPVDILWDRRRDERRRSAGANPIDQRIADRRQARPFTWDVADFVVVEDFHAPAKKSDD